MRRNYTHAHQSARSQAAQNPVAVDRYKFVCGKCQYVWYSSNPNDKKCAKCGTSNNVGIKQ
jgi:rubrerythrin